MESGRVTWINNAKGFGFIERPDSGDVFVHYRSIIGDGYKKLRSGEEVTFEIEDSPKGLQAVNVRHMQPDS
jgi:CspA family cold shock protein